MSAVDDRGDLGQPLKAYAVRPYSKRAPVVIGQLQASALQLAPQDTILFNEITEDLPLSAVQTAREDGEHQLEGRGFDHGRSLDHVLIIPRRCPSIQTWDITGASKCASF